MEKKCKICNITFIGSKQQIYCSRKCNFKDPELLERYRLRKIWRRMLRRCNNTNDPKYSIYGNRGIRVSEEWFDYENFKIWALNNGYESNLTIDRINNNGNYEPTNCRWTDSKTQARNKRTNRIVTAFGESKCLSQWAEDKRCQVSSRTLQQRINNGCNEEEAITKKPTDLNKTTKEERENIFTDYSGGMSRKELAIKYNINYHTMKTIIRRLTR